MSENIQVVADKSKKKKNKNKDKNKNPAAVDPSNPLANLLNASLFDKFSELMGQEKQIDFEKFEESERQVRQEMESIHTITSNIQNNKYDDFPDEQKKEPSKTGAKQSELDPQRKRLLGELNKKILLLEEKVQKIDTLSKEVGVEPKTLSILEGIKENLVDDIRRNKDLYKKFEQNF